MVETGLTNPSWGGSFRNMVKGIHTILDKRQRNAERQQEFRDRRKLEDIQQRAELASAALLESKCLEPLLPDVGINEPNVRLPKKWGVLPSTAKLEEEVEWVHQNRVLVIGTTRAGLVRLDWHLASCKPPSNGAVGLMQDAASNPLRFGDLLQKVKRGEVDEEGVDRVRGEKQSVVEIERILCQMLEAVES